MSPFCRDGDVGSIEFYCRGLYDYTMTNFIINVNISLDIRAVFFYLNYKN